MLNQMPVKRYIPARPIRLSKPKPQLASCPKPCPLSRRREWHTYQPWRYPQATEFSAAGCFSEYLLHNLESSLAESACFFLWREIFVWSVGFVLLSMLSLFWLFQSSSMKRPVIPIEFGAKVPNNIRQRYLNAFVDECLKFCPSQDVAFQMVRITVITNCTQSLMFIRHVFIPCLAYKPCIVFKMSQWRWFFM